MQVHKQQPIRVDDKSQHIGNWTNTIIQNFCRDGVWVYTTINQQEQPETEEIKSFGTWLGVGDTFSVTNTVAVWVAGNTDPHGWVSLSPFEVKREVKEKMINELEKIMREQEKEIDKTSDTNLMLAINGQVGIKTHFLGYDELSGEVVWRMVESEDELEQDREWLRMGNVIYPRTFTAEKLVNAFYVQRQKNMVGFCAGVTSSWLSK